MLTPVAGRDCIGKIVHLLLASSQSEAGTPKPVERQQHKKIGNKRDRCCQLKVHGDMKTLYTRLQFTQDSSISQPSLRISSLMLLRRTRAHPQKLSLKKQRRDFHRH